MITFKIDSADIILDDLGNGQGKIIIADTSWGYNFSYFWGAMGERSLMEFLSKINSDYFSSKLRPIAAGDINSKKTLKSIRAGLKEYFYVDFPWYTEMDFQRSLRSDLKSLELNGFSCPDDFFYEINRFVENLDYYLIDDNRKRNEIKEAIKSVFNEPWYYMVTDEHRQMTYLKKLHGKLIKHLKKNNLKTQIITQTT